MLIDWKRYKLSTLLVASLCLALAGCGGSGGGSATSTAGTTTLSGIAAKGPVKQARISVYKMKEDGTADTSRDLVLSGSQDMTDDAGHYSVSIPASSGPVVVMVRPILGTTTYMDETDPANAKPLTASLRAVVPDSDMIRNVAVTPLTEAAFGRVAAIRQINPGAGIADVVSAANFQMAQSFGVPDILTPPATAAFDPNSIANATPADQAYVAALTMVSQIVNNPGSNLAQAITTITTIVDPNASVNNRTDALGVISAAIAEIKTAVPTLPAGSLAEVSSAVTTTATNPVAPVEIVVRTLTAPKNLGQASLTYQSVGLAWDASPAAEVAIGYYVYRNGVMVAKVSQPAFVDTAVAADTSYSYQVKAFDATGNVSASSNTLAVTTPATPSDTSKPLVPTGLGIVSVGQNTATLTWTAATDNVGVAGYHVYRNGTLVAQVSANTQYADTGLSASTTYSYQVKAFDAAGNVSDFSSALSVTTSAPPSDTTPPAPPANLSATTFATGAATSSVVLSWTPSTDNVKVTGYEVYRDSTRIATVSQPGYTDANVSSGATSSYYVVAFDAAGNRSAQSSTLPVTPNQPSLGVTVNGQLSPGIIGLPGADISAPSAPASLSATTFATSATTSSVVLTWAPSTDNVGVAGYEVYRVTGTTSAKIATVSQPGYTVASAASGTPSTFFVMAFDAAGNRSVASNQLSVSPTQPSLGVTVNGQLSPGIIGLPSTDISAPTAPTGLSATTSAASATTSSVGLAWTPSTDNVGVAGYEVYRVAGTTSTRIATVSQSGYTVSNVPSGTSSTYFVIAIDAAGNRSAASNQLSVTPSQASLGVTVNGQLVGLPGL